MKKLLLFALFSLGFFALGCTAKTDSTENLFQKMQDNPNLSDKEKSFLETINKNPTLKECVLNRNTGCFLETQDACIRKNDKEACQTMISLINSIDENSSVERCDMQNCLEIGLIYAGAENHQQAHKYYRKACSLDDGLGCFVLGVSYAEGQGVEQDFFKAFKLYKKACDLNFSSACYNLAVFYKEGKGVRQDFANARKYYEKACEADHASACNNLGFLYENGQGVKQSNLTAKKYYGKACDLESQTGCNNYKILNEKGVK